MNYVLVFDLEYLQAEGLELTSPITGYTIGPNTLLTEDDSILQAFGKVQGQISNFSSGINFSSPITGYTIGPNTALSDTDLLLASLGKIQGQINARISGSITSGQVAFGSAVNTIGGDNGLTWNNTTKILDLLGATSSIVRVRGNTNGAAFYVNLINSSSTALAFGNGANISGSVPSTSNLIWSNSDLYINTGSNTRFFIGNTGLNGILTTSPTNTLDVNGTFRVRSIANVAGNFATYSATGVFQQRTAAQSADDILKSISGYSAGVNQRLEHNSSGVLNWVNT